MSSTSLTQDQIQQLQAVQAANPNDPAAIWAALSSFGDQYAAAAFQGLTNSQSLYGQVIANSNYVSGVTPEQFSAIESSVAVALRIVAAGGRRMHQRDQRGNDPDHRLTRECGPDGFDRAGSRDGFRKRCTALAHAE
jgi:hypothetical protein